MNLAQFLAGRLVKGVLVLFAIAGGVWADRLPRTLVMRAADAFRMVALLALAALPSIPPLWVLALLVFLVGGGEAFFRPAETALLPSILPPEPEEVPLVA